MGLNGSGSGETPLDEDEKDGLIIQTITTRSELNEFEQQNIEEAIQWAMNRSFKSQTIFSEQFVCKLHKQMFGNVWSWAGKFRKTNKNLGVDSWQIQVELKSLLDDSIFWKENNIFSPDEMAIRFKHRIVSIHCFPNGNGRHSRLIADIIVQKIFGLPVFSWGAKSDHTTQVRYLYLKALKAADGGNYSPLISFARS